MRPLLVSFALFAVLLTCVSPAAAAAGLLLEPPVQGRLVRGFDAPASPYAAGHRGVDLAGTAGTAVRAAAAGRVHFSGFVAGRGTVSIDHGNGWRTTYQPVTPGVGEGEVVAAGNRIGTLASGHCDGESCLHWGLTDGERYLDPLLYLETAVVRLLPAGSEPRPMPELPAARASTVGTLPVDGPVSSPFGMRRHPVTGVVKLHDGVDLAASCGTPVNAPSGGVVVDASFHVAYGYRVRIDHGGGLTMSYTHLPGLEVREGQQVAAGARIGRVGNTGLSTGCHLHWMAWLNGSLTDPLTLRSGSGG
ncbi:peptidoglycan DD-metalloendopeptidase family protein [Tessaracoccus sp. MC1627]|uniref:M23 family metallopeptidase n=1 Tax=Tessaracoccus sp. MC1627 TaxID=2760312 RepID=UPI0015FF3461|nr:peptidoglycan DD-metalloendopeptidase family protein [Tessaracoccus sp. MC1627]MBB1513074.1 peptidoglycan DD-metalloendopeptidase family protein [Tessaracoccus sp. MC1627]